MAGISFIGSYSGVDQTTIDKLMQVEKLPLNQLTKSKTDITAKQNAWKDVNTRLNSLFEKLKVLQSADTFNSMTAKSSNDSILSAAASKDAVAGKYDISVTRLATSVRAVGGKIDNVYHQDGELKGQFKELGFSGSFSITNEEGDSAKITVEADDTLKDIVNQINEKTKETGINATIIDSKLVLTDEKTGKRDITLENIDGTALSNLKISSAVGTDENNALFTINGIPITSDSNAVKDAVLGLTIDLNKTHATGEFDTITVATDKDKLIKAVQDFVDQYNSTMAFIEEQLAPGTVSTEGTVGSGNFTTTGRGTLAGDSSLRSLQSSLRTMVTASLGKVNEISNTGTSIKDISALGVKTTDKSGKLSFDSSKLLEEFAKDPQNVINFFSYEAKDAEGNYIKDEKGNNVNVGFISKLNTKIDSYISSSDGLIKSKNESFDRSLRDINKRIDSFNDRMVRKEAYYKKMFSALDVAMMQAESQMEWLSGQISAMNAQSGSKK